MIPKIIHYCWFGNKPLPESACTFIAGWKKVLPDYKIVRWDESNFPVTDYEYSKEAYERGKFAFVSDVARLYALYTQGGIYLDTDVEVIKNFDELIELDFFIGHETERLIGTAVIGSSANNSIVFDLLRKYKDIKFVIDGKNDLTTNVERVTNYFDEKSDMAMIGRNNAVSVFPIDYFSPKSYSTGEIRLTSNTFAIHHFDCSWYSPTDKMKAFLRRALGARMFYKLVSFKKQFHG